MKSEVILNKINIMERWHYGTNILAMRLSKIVGGVQKRTPPSMTNSLYDLALFG